MTPAEARVAYTACPLCGSERLEALRVGDCTRHPLYQPALPPTMEWVRCADCTHVFTRGYFTEAALSLVFGRTQSIQQVGHDLERQRHVSARIVAKVARWKPEGPWLDVGFGNGSLLLTAAEWGYAPVGLELRPQGVDALRALGCEAHCLKLEDYAPAQPLSVISMADVLEHVPFPKSSLEAARRLLEPGGVLFLSMPAYDSPLWRVLDAARANPYWGELEHYHNFSRERLRALLAEFGFSTLEYGISERYRACMEMIFRRDG